MQDQTLPRSAMDALLAPQSIALVGVSDRPDSYGHALDRMLSGGGFSGPILRVNPRLAAQSGGRIAAALADLPDVPEHVVLSLATDRVEAAVDEALSTGARALTLFAACPDAEMRRRIGDRVRAAGAALCGPNSMGFHNLTHGLRVTPFPVPLDLKPGGIGLIAQSGSILGALMNNDRRLRFSQAVSTGSETVTTAADYLHWMIDQPETRVVGLFLETVRDPLGFIAAMEAAAARDLPVVILKVGRSALSARMAISHTGALVGDDALFRALVRRLGGHMAGSVDEMAAMLALFAQGRRASAPGIASIHDSGGERELMADLAEDHGLSYASLAPETRARIQSVLEPGIAADNPLDAWGTGQGAQETYTRSVAAMMADPGVGTGLYVLNWRGNYYLHEMHGRALAEAYQQTDKPLAAVSNFSGSDDRAIAAHFADLGIPLLSGMQNAMAAVRALHDHGPVARFRPPAMPHPRAAAWRARLAGRDWIGEAEGYALFADYGIACPSHMLAASRDEAVQAARWIGGSVVLKTTQGGLSHKSDLAGVQTGLATPDAVAAAYEDLAERFDGPMLVAQMVDPGMEWSLGAVNDPDFGPAVRIAPGGLYVDLLGEDVLLMAPFTPDEAASAIAGLRAARLLSGYRGQPVLAATALGEAAAALSRMAWDLRDTLDEIESNPVIVGTQTATAVDAVLRLRPS
ncbi:acetate--CoA ligase family protein [Ruegeria pomeroyi]|nr:acetate--CoA ligase family protein [Ruegeria pomeroyi]